MIGSAEAGRQAVKVCRSFQPDVGTFMKHG